jgi:hypothetical protein
MPLVNTYSLKAKRNVAELSEYKKREIEDCRELFEASIASVPFQEWVNRAIEDFDFFEGRQTSPKETEFFDKIGMTFEVTNLIASRINALAGKEVSSRTRFKYKSRSGKPEERMQAEAISALALHVQERNKSSRVLSQAKQYARICGIGWHAFDVVNNRIVEVAENPLDVVWDVRDITPLMEKQGFVARVKWLTLEEAKRKFPQRKDELDAAETGEGAFLNFKFDLPDKSRWRMFDSGGYINRKDRLIAIVEFHYRKPATYYRATTERNEVFVTFDREEAEKKAASKKDVIPHEGYKVYVAYFTGNIPLDYLESPFQLDPATGEFLLTPVIHTRQVLDGQPYGLVHPAKGAQRNYNVKSNKRRWYMVSRGVRADKGAFDNPEAVATEINRPDYFIEVNAGKKVDIEDHSQRIAEITQDLAIHRAEIEQVTGIYDETLGVETNAQSGVAIQRRQAASNTTTIFAMDGYDQAQKDVASKMLWLIRNVYTGPVTLDVTDDEELAESLGLGETPLWLNRDDGKGRVYDVRMGEYDVVVERIPDADTMNDLAREGMMSLLQSNIGPEKWTPGLLDLFNIPKTAPLRKEVEEGVQRRLQEGDQMKAQMQKMIGSGMGPTPNAGGAQSPIQPNMGM